MKMERRPTFAGKAREKDERDIFYWAFEKTPWQRLQESWRLHCLNHNIKESENKLNKSVNKASKRS